MNNQKKSSHFSPDLLYPGVFKVECIPEKRAYFAAAPGRLFLKAAILACELEDGVFENQQLVEDYKKYGNSSFVFDPVVCGEEYYDEEERKAALEAAKAAWEGELY